MSSTTNSQKIIKGISSQTIVTLVLSVVEIISFSIMSRLLTKEDFGYYAAMSAIVAIFACFSDAGIGSAIIQQKDPSKKYINNAFTISLLFGIVVSLTLFAASGFIAKLVTDSSMTFPLQLMSITLILNCLNSVNISIMYRRLEFFRVGMINLVSLVITTIVAVVLAIKGFGYYAIIAKSILFSAISLCLSFVFAHTRYRIELDVKTFKQIFGFSGWLMASGLFRNVAHDIDKLLMSRLLSVASLGSYNRPKDFLGQISNKLTGIFDSALFPILSGIQDENEKIKRAFRESLYYMNIIGMLLTLVLAFNCELLIRVFFGSKWLELSLVTFILSFLMLFNIDGRLADCFLRSLGLTKQQFFFRIIETIITLIGVLIGAHWDIMGVAIAVVLTNMVLKLSKIFYVSYRIRIPFWITMREILVSWRFAIIFIPFCILLYMFFPHTLFGNILQLCIIGILLMLIFLVFPSIVGEHYKNNGYTSIVQYLRKLKNKMVPNNNYK